MTLYVSTLCIGIPSIIIALHLLTTTYALRFDPNVAYAAHDMVSGLLAIFQGYYFNRVRGIVGTHDQVAVCSFDVADDASAVFRYGVYVTFALAVWSQRIIVAVEQQGGTGHGAGIHAHSALRIRLDDNEAFPTLAVAFYILLQALQEALLNFRLSLTCMLIISGWVAAICGST